MKRVFVGLALVLCVERGAWARDVYVSLTSASPAPPYTSWETAAHTIQEAVDEAAAGDVVWVANGKYASGGKVMYGSLTNRVAIDKAIAVRSLNGMDATAIVGAGPIGDDFAVRCAYVGTNAALIGFTLTNGHTRTSGDWLRERCGGGAWCEASGVLSNCTVVGCEARSNGGGVRGGTIFGGRVVGNEAVSGAGTSEAAVYDCVLAANRASGSGGGAENGTLTRCTLEGNAVTGWSGTGGGSHRGELRQCSIRGNMAQKGGGVYMGSAYGCVVYGNRAHSGGGAAYGTLKNCTVLGNRADTDGGGAIYATLRNTIVYDNEAATNDNVHGGNASYCCTTPEVAGTSNIVDDPLLAGVAQLSTGSPCLGRGNAADATGSDFDGEAWATPPAIGCDERVVGGATGALAVTPWVSHTEAVAGFPVAFRADVVGRATSNEWNFGDGALLANRAFVRHTFAAEGRYPVALKAYNDTNPGGVTATVVVEVAARKIHYACPWNPAAAAPYTNEATAASSIQDAVDAATQGGALVRVAAGTYAGGARTDPYGRMRNRVVIDKPVTVRGAAGPAETVIQGAERPENVRGAYVSSGAALEGVTITGGYSENDGGGLAVVGGSVSNCVVSNCVCVAYGGGAAVWFGRVSDCDFLTNRTDVSGTGSTACGGGGVYLAGGSILEYSSVVSNTASDAMDPGNEYGFNGGWGGGVYMQDGCVVHHCEIAFNRSGNGSTRDPYAWEGGNGGYGGHGGGLLAWNGGRLSDCAIHGNRTGDGGGGKEDPDGLATYEGGSGGYGGGVYVGRSAGSAAGLALVDCVISNNVTGDGAMGAGTETESGAPGSGGSGGGAYFAVPGTVAGCTFAANLTGNGAEPWFEGEWAGDGGDGGGLAAGKGVDVFDCDFQENRTGYDGGSYGGRGNGGGGCISAGRELRVVGNEGGGGGGICATSLRDCVIARNRGSGGAGVLVLSSGCAADCVVSNNASSGTGGGVSLSDGAGLRDCIVCFNTATDGSGGGIYSYRGGNVTNVLVYENRAKYGGGVCLNSTTCDFFGTVCSNTAIRRAGGIDLGSASHCRGVHVYANTISSDVDDSGGGAHLANSSSLEYATVNDNAGRTAGVYVGSGCTVTGCVVYFNIGVSNVMGSGTITNCCCEDFTGEGSLTNDPLFVDREAGDCRLRPDSPCVDRGGSADGPTSDLLGVPRPVDGDTNGVAAIDLGAYEYMNPYADDDGDHIPNDWEVAHGLNMLDGGDAHDNPDGDAHDNYAEYVADTDPLSATNVLCILEIDVTHASGPSVAFMSSSNRVYSLMRASDARGDSWTNIAGTTPRGGAGGLDVIVDPAPSTPACYRIKVALPE